MDVAITMATDGRPVCMTVHYLQVTVCNDSKMSQLCCMSKKGTAAFEPRLRLSVTSPVS